VSVDGCVVRNPALAVVPERVRIAIDGEPARRPRLVTVVLNKPRGVVTTARDPEGRPTVLDLVADIPVRVVPVGRLDLATTGLRLLTNDTRFADWVTDPAEAELASARTPVVGAELVSALATVRLWPAPQRRTIRRPAARLRKSSLTSTKAVV